MAAIETAVDYVALAELLDLPLVESVEEQVAALRECRAFQLETLAARDPEWIPTATLLRLRATCAEEVRVCEEALAAFGVELDASAEEDDQS